MGIKMTAGCNSGACNHNSSDKTLEVCANRGKCAGNNIVHAEISKVRNSGGGSENVHIGVGAGSKNTSGSNNVFVGTKAGAKSNGSGNIMVGYGCANDTVGSGNILIGTGKTDTNIDNSLRIFRGENSIIEGTFGASGSLNSLTINGDLTVNAMIDAKISNLNLNNNVDLSEYSKTNEINSLISDKLSAITEADISNALADIKKSVQNNGMRINNVSEIADSNFSRSTQNENNIITLSDGITVLDNSVVLNSKAITETLFILIPLF